MHALRERRPQRSINNINNSTNNAVPLTHTYRSPLHVKNFHRLKTFLSSKTNVLILVQLIINVFLLLSLFLNRSIQREDNPSSDNAFKTSSSLPSQCDFYITIYGYDRPKHLLYLLQDIAKEADIARVSVGVNIIDDNSYSCSFSPASYNIFQKSTHSNLRIVTTTNTNDSLNSNKREEGEDVLYQVPLPNTLRECSASHRFREVEKFVHSRNIVTGDGGWRIFVSPYRHGRRRYWHLIRHAHNILQSYSPRAKYYIFLPDDDRLSTNFFRSVMNMWLNIQDDKKLTMMLHVEQTREHTAVWTDLKPIDISNNMSRIGWVESGNFLCTSTLLQFLNWSFPYIPPRRWIDNPPISSGVGAALSELIHSSGHRMYRTKNSFVAHTGITLSKMNAAFREVNKENLRTKYFMDGEQRYDKLLLQASTVTASMASHWVRQASLHKAIHSLSTQVDHLNVFLNGYDHIPSFLQVPFITVMTSEQTRQDLGDVGKFYWANEIHTEYHMTADDDIEYPVDYVEKMISFRQTFDQTAVVVGVHGIRIRHDWLHPVLSTTGRRRAKGRGYYDSREVWMATEDVRDAVAVHIIGTGTMLYKVSDIGKMTTSQVFAKKNMADIWFGLLTQRLKIPMMIIPHSKGWIKEVDGTFDDSIYKHASQRRSTERDQTRAARSIPQWKLNTAKQKP